MARLPELSADLQDKLNDLMGESGDAMRAGDGAKSIDDMEKAWEMLPEPKDGWDFYPQTIARGVVETLAECSRCDVMDRWLQRMYQTHFDPERSDSYTNMVAAHALFQCDRKEEALAIFKAVLAKDGPTAFKGFYRPYLDMVQA